MSRGPGKIERALETLFRENPSDHFTTTELVERVFPGANRVEKKHRVSTMRAAYKAAARTFWLTRRQGGVGGELVFYNGCDRASYDAGFARAHSRCSRAGVSDRVARSEADDHVLARVGREIRTTQIEANVLARDGRHDDAAALRNAMKERYRRFG